jgi:hypothetical protein
MVLELTAHMRDDLRTGFAELIVKNIYDTEGHWLVDNDAGVSVSSWFVFEYFYNGSGSAPTSNYSETDKLLQQT